MYQEGRTFRLHRALELDLLVLLAEHLQDAPLVSLQWSAITASSTLTFSGCHWPGGGLQRAGGTSLLLTFETTDNLHCTSLHASCSIATTNAAVAVIL